MKIKAIEIVEMYVSNDDWNIKTSFCEVVDYTTHLLSQISISDDFGYYNITLFDFFIIIEKLTKKFSCKP